ncbi:type IV pilin, partial [Methanocorpusculaceae archaeon]|nr:type IV pilin [Methanocorpusculaceae archaeon]
MKRQGRKEDAASPVIGVMLMLVVTVVIAAVITVFATGMAGESTATTPMALLEADNPQMEGSLLKSFDIVHKGGDKVSKENIQVVIEPSGSDSSYGILLVRTAANLEVQGKTGED